jgi:hypothetical protein
VKKLAISTVVAATAAVLAVPAVAHASTPTTCTATFAQHPESGAGWAVDTFKRTTTIRPAGKGWKVHIADVGTFTSVPGKPSDGDNSVPIENEVTGTLRGRGDYTVTGTDAPPTCPSQDTYNGTNDPSTGDWPKLFFPAGATATGIDPWHWDYRTGCEHMVEDSRFSKVDGNIVGKVCPTEPTPTPTDTTPAPSPSESTPGDGGTTPPGDAPTPTPVPSDLPVTG